MSEQPAPISSAPEPLPADPGVDAVLAEFNGDARAAIAALLHDLEVLATDRDLTVSRGYVRGQTRLRRARL